MHLKKGVGNHPLARWWKVCGRLEESSLVLWYSPLDNPCTDHTCMMQTSSAPSPQLPWLLWEGLHLTCSEGEQETQNHI